MVFRTYEAVQRQVHYQNVFAEETLFKTQWTFKARFDGVSKRMYDPLKKQYFKANYWYGQGKGKSAVRTSIGAKPKTVHKFVRMDGSSLTTENEGCVLHYHAYDFEDFVKKFENFKNRPNTFLSGNSIEYVKLLWREVVNNLGYSKKDLLEYFEKSVMFTPAEIKKAQSDNLFGLVKRKQPAFTIMKGPQSVFSALGLNQE